MQFIDTHCHLNFDAFDTDRDDIITQANAVGVQRLIIPGVDIATSHQAIALAEAHPGIYAAVGIHPNSSTAFAASDIDALRSLARHPKVVAIGEIGLDYHWDMSLHAQQAHAFEAQLALATELHLPVIIHNRDAHEDVMTILEAWQPAPDHLPGVLHSFSAPSEMAQRALAIGFMIGLSGPFTYKKADDLRHIAAGIPLDRLLLETDAPYLTPEPFRGKRNTPANIPLIAERLAGVLQLTLASVAEATTANAVRLFGLG